MPMKDLQGSSEYIPKIDTACGSMKIAVPRPQTLKGSK